MVALSLGVKCLYDKPHHFESPSMLQARAAFSPALVVSKSAASALDATGSTTQPATVSFIGLPACAIAKALVRQNGEMTALQLLEGLMACGLDVVSIPQLA